MKIKHSFAPWFVGCSTQHGMQIVQWDEKFDRPKALIATVNTKHTIECGKEISEEVRANARLIASSPKLYAALLKVMEKIPDSELDNWGCYETVTNALQEAEYGNRTHIGGE